MFNYNFYLVQKYGDFQLKTRNIVYSSSSCCDGGRDSRQSERNGLKSVAKSSENINILGDELVLSLSLCCIYKIVNEIRKDSKLHTVHDTMTPFLLRFHYVQTLIMIEWTVDKWTNG